MYEITPVCSYIYICTFVSILSGEKKYMKGVRKNVHRKLTNDTVARRKRNKKRQTVIHKTLHRKLNTEQRKLH